MMNVPSRFGKPRRWWRLWRRRFTLFGVTVVLLLGALEIVLGLAPAAFGQARANTIFSRSDSRPGGIYAREPLSGVRFMWPDLTADNYWNGYRWQHASDHRGFRNPPGTPTEVLLVGDSLIYGHGVEEVETVAHFLRVEHGVGAYNMGRQGAGLYDEYVYLRTFLDELAPKRVVLFVFLNDFGDQEVNRTADEFATTPEIDRLDYAAIRKWARTMRDRYPSGPLRWLWRRPSLRLLLTVLKELQNLELATPAWAAGPAAEPPFLAPLRDPDRLEKLATYYLKIVADLAERCRARGVALNIVYLSAGANPKNYDDAQENAVGLVRDAATRAGLDIADTRPVFAGCEACFLPRDGHFTTIGHRSLARFLASTILREAPSP